MATKSGEKVLVLMNNLTLRRLKVFEIMIVVVVLGACAHSDYQAPVTDMIQPPSKKVNSHIVAAGETLYSIAWRYDLDYASLANANKIGSDYRIYPGQMLNLSVESRKPWAQKRNQETKVTIAQKKPHSVVSRSENETIAPKNKSNELMSIQPQAWQWPLEGRILSGFSANNGLHKGIDIHGKLGEAVVAASAGVVVYSGDGLRGYGNLLIVKHSDTYLSAYAHNRRLLVREGDSVQAGQKIAEVGSTGTNSVKLYFEIRRDGKPVNPLHYLPKNSSKK